MDSRLEMNREARETTLGCCGNDDFPLAIAAPKQRLEERIKTYRREHRERRIK